MLKVILQENVENLGKMGETVRVSEGYARNYLLPKKLVVIADENNLRSMEHHKRALERKQQKTLKEAQGLSAKLENFSCTISRKVGEHEKLFGSVTSADVALVLQKEGFTVDKKQIAMAEPIKQLGVTTVSVKLHPEVSSQLKVWVVAEK